VITTVFERDEPSFIWLDVCEPTKQELTRLAAEQGLHPNAVEDCLDPEHLPKHERFGDVTFLIVRAFDELAAADATSAQQLTRKLAIFRREGLLLTIHRKEQPYLEPLRRTVSAALAAGGNGMQAVIDLVSGVLETYWKPLETAEAATSSFEEGLFERRDVKRIIQQIYTVKRRITTIRWIVRHTLEILPKLRAPSESAAPVLQDLKETGDSLYFAADELLEDLNNLLNHQLSVAAHDTNDVMRVLTIFSVFFMPLTFIVGVYGMNFHHMPELTWHYGYPFAFGLMFVTVVGIGLWFRSKGWMK